jgi:hypothetical protein
VWVRKLLPTLPRLAASHERDNNIIKFLLDIEREALQRFKQQSSTAS